MLTTNQIAMDLAIILKNSHFLEITPTTIQLDLQQPSIPNDTMLNILRLTSGYTVTYIGSTFAMIIVKNAE